MQFLIIDVGNTNTVFSIYDEQKFIISWRISTKIERTSDEYRSWLDTMINNEERYKIIINEIIIGTVVPAVSYELKKMCLEKFNTKAKVVGEDIKIKIKTNVSNPEEVGTDRLVNSLAAWKKYNSATIIIDFGTATTFDIIDRKGVYLGGVIAPGINLSLEALHMAAARLPRIAITKPKKVIGNSTITAMQSGVYWGYVSLIEGIINRIIIERKQKMKVIATGGMALMFSSATRVIQKVDENLTTFGLYEAYKMNKFND